MTVNIVPHPLDRTVQERWDLPLHKRVRLIHPGTGRKAEAEVVWRSHEAWDAGFELVKPDATFWGP